MAKYTALGATLTADFNGDGSFVAMGQILSISRLAISRRAYDITDSVSQQSDIREYALGTQRTIEPFSMLLAYDPDNAQHITFRDKLLDVSALDEPELTPITFRTLLSAGVEEDWEFTAFITEVALQDRPVDGRLLMQVIFQPVTLNVAVTLSLLEESIGYYEWGHTSELAANIKTNCVIHPNASGTSAIWYGLDNGTQVGLDVSTNDFVIQAWVARDEEATQSRIIGKGNVNATDLGYSLEVTNDVVKFRIGDGTSSAEVTGTVKYRRWHHLIASADRDGNIELFIDGVSAGTAVALAGTLANTADFVFFSTDAASTGTRRFLGLATMFGFWSGITMDAAAAAALYNSGIPVNYDAMTAGQKASLVSFWELNEYKGATVGANFGFDRLAANNLTRTNADGSWNNFRFFNKPAAQFISASSQYLEITDAAQTNLSPGASPFTFLAWVRATSAAVARSIGGKWVTGQREWVLTLEADDSVYFFCSSTGSGGTSASTAMFPTYSQYKLVAGVWDGTNVKISLDGAAFVSAAFAGPVHQDVAPFRIGSYNGGSFMNGDIALAAFWSRALTVDELSALARGFSTLESPLEYSELSTDQKLSLVSWWKLDEKTGTRVDAHGNNDLTDNNSVGYAEGLVQEPAAEYTTPAGVNAAITKWINRSTLASANKLGDLRAIRPGFAPRLHTDGYLDWNSSSQGGLHTEIGQSSQPGTVIILGTTTASSDVQWFFDGYHPSMDGTVDRWGGNEGNPGSPMQMRSPTGINTGVNLASGQTLWFWIFDGADSEFHQDASAVDPVPSSPGTGGLVGLSVGSKYVPDSFEPFVGQIKYVIIVPRRLTAAEITSLIADLNP